MEAARRQEVKTGPALVRTSISGQVKDYSVEIQRIDMTGNKKNKSLVNQDNRPGTVKFNRWDHPGNQRFTVNTKRKDHRSHYPCVCPGSYKRIWDIDRGYDFPLN